jgi:glucokinase
VVNSLVVDVGGTRIKAGVLQDAALVAQQSIDANASQGLAAQLPRIVTVLESLCRDAGIAVEDCAALAVAFPGLIDASTQRIRDAAFGKYADAAQLDLPRWSQDTLGLQLLLENDARMALLGEWRAGAGRGSDDLVMVTLGTGLGTAVLVTGLMMQGKHGQAGILGGHLTIQHDGRLCACGNLGCAEAEASTSVLPILAAQAEGFTESPLCRSSTIDYATVLQLAHAGDPCSMRLRHRSLRVWSSMIVNLVHAYDPERVIVGGGVMAANVDFLDELTELVLARVNTPWGRVELVPGQLADQAALFGGEFMITKSLTQR